MYFAGVALLIPAAILIFGFGSVPLVRLCGLIFIAGSMYLITQSREKRA
jgi:hypothetical protein